MNCACGTTLTTDAKEAICGDCGRRNTHCPACSGGISAAPQAVVIACPYCDSPLTHRELGDQAPYFPVNLSESEAREHLLRFLLNRFGIPADLERRWEPSHCEQVFLPIHLFTVTARINESIAETDTTTVIGAKGLWYGKAIASYRFAAKVKQQMDPDQIQAKIYPLAVSHGQARKQAHQFGIELLARDRERFAVKEKGEITDQAEGQVFYPLYELEYRYKGTRYRGLVDAANGVVCTAEHPMSMRSRAMVMMAGAGLGGFTVVSALVFFALADSEPALVGSGLLVLATGGLSCLRIFWTALRSHKSGEEVASTHDGLALNRLTSTFAVSERKLLG